MNFHPSPAGLLALAALATVASVHAQSTVALHNEVLLGSGQTPPSSGGISNDFPPGTLIGTGSAFFAAPVTDLNGTLVFRARAADGGGITPSNGWGWYMGRTNADLRLIVRASDQAPGLAPGIQLRATSTTSNPFGSMRISPQNEILLFGSALYDGGVTVTTANDSALFLGLAGSFTVHAREGDPVQTLTNGEVYGALSTSNQDAWLTSSGITAFKNTLLVGTGGVTINDDSIVMYGPTGNLQVLAREGSLWNGVGATGERHDRFNANINSPISSLNMNDLGMILHDVHFLLDGATTPPVTATNDRVIAIWDGVTDHIVAREGDQAPGLPAGALFTDVSAFAPFASIPQNGFNKSGTFVITATPVGGGLTATDDNCMFMGSLTSPLALILREGDPAPASMGPGVFFGVPNSAIQLNDAGQLAFFANVTGAGVTTANDSCLFTGTPGNWTLVAREGDPAPGVPGFNLGAIQAGNVVLNEHGDLQFGSVQITDGTNPRSTHWSWTEQHGLRLFFDPIESLTLPLGPTTLNTTFNSAGGIQSGDSGAVMFGGNGDVAFAVTTNSSELPLLGFAVMRAHVGSLVATPSAVPVAGGVPQDFFIDCGPNQAGKFYLVLATALGTRPGFISPFGGQQVSLNPDPLWTTLSLNNPNSIVWVNTGGFLDANGVGVGPSSFVMPPGFPGFLGTTLHHAVIAFDLAGGFTTYFASEPSAVKLY